MAILSSLSCQQLLGPAMQGPMRAMPMLQAQALGGHKHSIRLPEAQQQQGEQREQAQASNSCLGPMTRLSPCSGSGAYMVREVSSALLRAPDLTISQQSAASTLSHMTIDELCCCEGRMLFAVLPSSCPGLAACSTTHLHTLFAAQEPVQRAQQRLLGGQAVGPGGPGHTAGRGELG